MCAVWLDTKQHTGVTVTCHVLVLAVSVVCASHLPQRHVRSSRTKCVSGVPGRALRSTSGESNTGDCGVTEVEPDQRTRHLDRGKGNLTLKHPCPAWTYLVLCILVTEAAV